VHLSGFEPVQVSATDKIARREVKGAKNFFQEVLDTAREMINFAEKFGWAYRAKWVAQFPSQLKCTL
jgi:hypothetical protein